MTPEELQLLGFRWSAPTELETADGQTVTVAPSAYVKSKENPGMTDRELKTLRLYSVVADEGIHIEPELSELDIEKLIGDE